MVSTAKKSLCLAAAALILAGCGQSTTAASQTSTTTSSSPTATASPAMSTVAKPSTVSGPELANRMLTALQAAKTFKVDMKIAGPANSAAAMKMNAKVQFVGARSNQEVTVAAQGLNLSMIVIADGQAVYVKSPQINLPKYTKVDKASKNPVIVAMAQQLGSMTSQFDTKSQVEMYRKAGNFTAAGEQTINGVKTTKYTGQVAASALPDGKQLGKQKIPVTVFLDGEDRPIRYTLSVKATGATSGITADYSAFGSPIVVKAP